MSRSPPSFAVWSRTASPGRARVGAGDRFRLHAVVAQGARHQFAGRPVDHEVLDGEHVDALRLEQQRHGEGHGARGLGALVPGNDDGVADGLDGRRRRQQHGAPAFEDRGFRRRHARIAALVSGPAHDRHVEHAGVARRLAVAQRMFARPAACRRRACAGPARLVQRHAVLHHEALELAMGFVGDLAPCVLVRNRPAHRHVERHEIGQVGSQRRPLDVAAESPRQKHGGPENGIGRRMQFDRHKNRLHDTPPRRLSPKSPRVSPEGG